MKKVIVTKSVEAGEQVNVAVGVGVIVAVSVGVEVRVKVAVVVGVNMGVSVMGIVPTIVTVSVATGFTATEVSEDGSARKKPTTSRGASGWEVN